MRISVIVLVFAGLFCTCAPSPASAQFPYDLAHPELLAAMPDELEEISGLAVDGDDLLAIEDEHGVVYRLDRATGEVKSKTEFWEDGDYEGITLVDRDIWVTKSNGKLYRIRNAGSDEQDVEELGNWLKGENDVEGLTYDPAGNRLLLACKDDPKGNGMAKENRYIFAFDLEAAELGEAAAYTIPREDEFAPSSLAIHPQSGQLYLTSSVGKQLLVANPDGTIETVRKLDKRYFPQPEGLCFASDGTLYISTEARDGEPGRIYRLPLRP